MEIKVANKKNERKIILVVKQLFKNFMWRTYARMSVYIDDEAGCVVNINYYAL